MTRLSHLLVFFLALTLAQAGRALDAASAMELLKLGGRLTVGVEVGLSNLQGLARLYKDRIHVRANGMSYAEVDGCLASGAGVLVDKSLPVDQIRALCSRGKGRVWVDSRDFSFTDLMNLARYGSLIYMDVDSTYTASDRQTLLRQGGCVTVDSRMPIAVVRGMVELAPARVLIVARGFYATDLAVLVRKGASVIADATFPVTGIMTVASGGSKHVIVVADAFSRTIQIRLAGRGIHLVFMGSRNAGPAIDQDQGQSVENFANRADPNGSRGFAPTNPGQNRAFPANFQRGFPTNPQGRFPQQSGFQQPSGFQPRSPFQQQSTGQQGSPFQQPSNFQQGSPFQQQVRQQQLARFQQQPAGQQPTYQPPTQPGFQPGTPTYQGYAPGTRLGTQTAFNEGTQPGFGYQNLGTQPGFGGYQSEVAAEAQPGGAPVNPQSQPYVSNAGALNTPIDQRPVVKPNSIFAPPPGSQTTEQAASMFAPPPESAPLRSNGSMFAPPVSELVDQGGPPLVPPLTNTGGALPQEQGLGGGGTDSTEAGLAPTLGRPILAPASGQAGVVAPARPAARR
jgi:hypothetical protein